LFLGSSCVYPRLAPQPLKEEYLLTGPLEPTNEPYALGKIAGIELCSAFNRQYGTRFMSVMPTNLYGPGDSYDLRNSHVLPAFIRKFHLARLAAQGDWKGVQRDRDCHGPIPDRVLGGLRAIATASGHAPPDSIAVDGGGFAAPHGTHAPREGASAFRPAVVLWGTGKPRREFLYSEDAADACIFLMERAADLFQETNGGATAAGASGRAVGASLASRHLFNVGCGQDLTIRELAQRVAAVVGYDGPVEWDVTKPDGTPRKLLDVSVLNGLGWTPRVHLQEGIGRAYADYVARSR
jgi:GDP-L-fucose synthase